MVDEVLDYRYLFAKGTIPLPAKPFCLPKGANLHHIISRLDAFADEVAAAYPDKRTGALIRSMYHDHRNVTFKEGLINEGMFASHRRSTGMYEPEHAVALDASLESCPLLKRLFMIHEIGVHVGQFRERAVAIRDRVGHVALIMVDTPHYRHFTEMTAACIDKLLIDSIPMRFVDAEIESMSDDYVRKTLSTLVADWRNYSIDEFMRMEHRKQFADGQISARELAMFTARPEVEGFKSHTYAMSLCHGQNRHAA